MGSGSEKGGKLGSLFSLAAAIRPPLRTALRVCRRRISFVAQASIETAKECHLVGKGNGAWYTGCRVSRLRKTVLRVTEAERLP